MDGEGKVPVQSVFVVLLETGAHPGRYCISISSVKAGAGPNELLRHEHVSCWGRGWPLISGVIRYRVRKTKWSEVCAGAEKGTMSNGLATTYSDHGRPCRWSFEHVNGLHKSECPPISGSTSLTSTQPKFQLENRVTTTHIQRQHVGNSRLYILLYINALRRQLIQWWGRLALPETTFLTIKTILNFQPNPIAGVHKCII